jgi:signal transduction histidine kinase
MAEQQRNGARRAVAPARESGMRPRFEVDAVRDQTALCEIAQILDRAATTRAAFTDLVTAIARVLPLAAVVVVSADERERPLVWSATGGGRELLDAEGVARAALQYLRAESSLDELSPFVDGGDTELPWIALPIVEENGELLGAIAVALASGRIAERELAIVASVARALAQPMHAGRAADDPPNGRVAWGERPPLVAELAATLTDSLDYTDALDRLARIVTRHLAIACVVELTHTCDAEPWISSAHQPHVEHALRPLLDAVVDTRTTLAAANGDGPALAAARALGIDGVIACPLHLRSGVVGVLAIASGGALTIADAELLAARAAIAVENGRRYERALRDREHREQLLAMVSHDLKNSVGIVLLAATRILDDMPKAARASDDGHQLTIIRRSAQRMRKLVADLLDVAAVDSGAMTMRPARCDARALIREAHEGFALVAADAGVTLVDDVVGVLPEVWADPDRILQVLTNLITNALKFTPRGGHVRFSACVIPGAVAITVADEGCGIARADIPHVFDRFWHGGEGSAAKTGTGLGLAICKSIVELSGGAIAVESEIDAGTAMVFTLPLAPRAPAIASCRERR